MRGRVCVLGPALACSSPTSTGGWSPPSGEPRLKSYSPRLKNIGAIYKMTAFDL